MKPYARWIVAGLFASMPSWGLACTVTTGEARPDAVTSSSESRTAAAITVTCPQETPYSASVSRGDAATGARAAGSQGTTWSARDLHTGMIVGTAGPLETRLDISSLLPTRPADDSRNRGPLTVVIVF